MPRILVVERHPRERELIRTLLQESDYDVELVGEAGEALQAMEEQPPDMVLAEFQPQGRDGENLLEELRRDYPQIPLVLLTAHGDEQVAVRTLKEGAASYVPLPSVEHELVATVRAVLEGGSGLEEQLRVLGFLDRVELQLSLDNDVELIPSIVQMVQTHLERMRLLEEGVRIQIGMALHEAVANAILHGNLDLSSDLREEDLAAYYRLAADRRERSPYKDRKVEVTVDISKIGIRFTVRDDGAGFDPAHLPDPTDPAQLDKIRGRGLFLIRTFMDQVDFSDRGNEITMFKNVRPAAE